MPKSSKAIRTPKFCSLRSVSNVAALSLSRAVSVISSSSRPGFNPAATTALTTA